MIDENKVKAQTIHLGSHISYDIQNFRIKPGQAASFYC